jgi:hypothetical protein
MSSAKVTYSKINITSVEKAVHDGFSITPNLQLSFQSRNIPFLNGY